MQCYLVSYDLIKLRKDYPDIHRALTAADVNSIKILESTWIVQWAGDPAALANHIIQVGKMDANDKLIVLPLPVPHYTYAHKNIGQDVINWLASH